MKMIDLERGHVFRMRHDNKLYLLSEAYEGRSTDDMLHYMFEWHRVYRDGRTNIHGEYTESHSLISHLEVEDLGDLYDWMKQNHPIRYKRENWDVYRYDRIPSGELLINDKK